MQRRVTRPPHGMSWRAHKGYVEGIFMVDGRRRFLNLSRLDDVLRNGSGRRRTAKQVNDAVGVLWEARRMELERELPARPDRYMMGQVFEDWITDTGNRGRAAETLRIHRLCRDYYLATAGDHPVEELVGSPPRPGYDLAHADRFLAGLRERELSPARINTYLGRLSSALRFAVRRYQLTRSPEIERVARRRRPAKVPHQSHIQAIRRRLLQLSRHTRDSSQRYHYRLHRLLFYLLLFTGMRAGEAVALRREQITLERRAILLVETKTGEPRVVRIGRFLAGKLRAHMAAHPGQVYLFEHYRKPGEPAWYGRAGATTAFLRHMDELGIKGEFKVLHGYRAGFSTSGLNELRIPGEVLREQLGHADLQTTLEHYVAGLGDAQLAMVEAMEALFVGKLRESPVNPRR